MTALSRPRSTSTFPGARPPWTQAGSPDHSAIRSASSQTAIGALRASLRSGVKRTRVVSSSVAAVGYDEETRTLEVEFLDGRVYRYFAVPPHVPATMLTGSVSVGRFLNDEIKGRYRYEKL